MPSLGAVGIQMGMFTPSSGAAAPFWWHNRLNWAVGTQMGFFTPASGGYLNGRVPVVLVTVIIGDFGQAGGGVTIF